MCIRDRSTYIRPDNYSISWVDRSYNQAESEAILDGLSERLVRVMLRTPRYIESSFVSTKSVEGKPLKVEEAVSAMIGDRPGISRRGNQVFLKKVGNI